MTVLFSMEHKPQGLHFSPKHSPKGLWWMVPMTAESKAVLTPPLSKKKNSGDDIFQKLLKFFLNALCVPWLLGSG